MPRSILLTMMIVGWIGLLGLPARGQQLLQNRSCESSDVSGWTEVDGLNWDCTNRDPASPRDGSNYFWMSETSTSGVLKLEQTHDATAGTVFSFVGQYFTEDLNGDDEDLAGIVVDLLDASGTVLETIVSTGTSQDGFVERTDGTWTSASGLARAPVGTETVRVQLRVEDGASGGNVEAYLDDLQLIGKVQITEIMQNPDAVSDSDGEYVELYNSTASSVNLDGWTLNGQAIGSVTVPARGFAVLCRNSDVDQNGGIGLCDDELSFSLGDDVDTVTLADGNGLTIDQVGYDTGAGWPDPSGESMIFTALTGTSTAGNWATAPRRERGFQLDGSSGDLGSPGRTGTDQIVQPTASVANGSAGWQMLSAPASGVTPNALARANLLQGLSGHYPDADPTLYQWPGGTEPNNDWTTPSGPSVNLTGKAAGFIWFVFDTKGPTGKTDPPPFTVSAPGVARTTDVTTGSLSGTSTSNSAFHLLGNPFGRCFDLSGLNLDAQGFQSTVQVWDPSQETYVGQSSGNLSAYQGFFVEKATSGSATLTFDYGATSFCDASLKSTGPAPSQVSFRLTGQSAEGDTVTQDRALTLSVRPEAATGWDAHDASKLVPLSGAYVTAAFRGPRDGASVWQAVRSLPPSVDSMRIPVRLRASAAGAVDSLTLAWSAGASVPQDWRLAIHDRARDSTVQLRDRSSYTFARQQSKGKADTPQASKESSSTPVPPRSPGPRPRSKAAGDSSRLVLTIRPRSAPRGTHVTAFNVGRPDAAAVLTWTTTQEERNAGFRVKHRGPEADRFRTVGFVEGQGTTTTPHDYRYRTDPLETVGTHAFRLVQVTEDGATRPVRTGQVSVAPSGGYTATIRPHPVSHTGTLRLAVEQSQTVRVEIYDLLGRRVGRLFDRALSANEPVEVTFDPDRRGLLSGTYVLRIRGETFTATRRLVIVR